MTGGFGNGGSGAAAALLPPVFRVLGCSGSGKTTFIVSLLHRWRAREPDLRIGVVKHSRHLDLPPPGKDTASYVHAGAAAVLGVTPTYGEAFLALPATRLWAVLRVVAPDLDVILVEGAREIPLPTLALGPYPPESKLGEMMWKGPARPDVADELVTLVSEARRAWSADRAGIDRLWELLA